MYKICSHRQSKNKWKVIEDITTSALVPVFAAFPTGWCKEACARKESLLVLIALKYQNSSSAIPPPSFLHRRGKSIQKNKKSKVNKLPQTLGSSKKLLAVQKHHQKKSICIHFRKDREQIKRSYAVVWVILKKKNSDTLAQEKSKTLHLKCFQAHYILLKCQE